MAGGRGQRGIVIVLVAIALLAVLVMVGLAIDTGHWFLNKSRLQSTVDAAALAAAKVLNDTEDVDQARTAANSLLTLNRNEHLDYQTAEGMPEPTIQFSHTLDPFRDGSTPAEYVRVIVDDLPTSTTFLTLLGYENLFSRASAVAGPSAPIVAPCDLFPVAVCAVPGSTGPYWGYAPYGKEGNTVTLLKLASQASGATFGPGNFQLIRLGGSGGSDARRNCAGGAACAPAGEMLSVETKPGNVTGPIAQGMNTRFGQYDGPMKGEEAKYPPDLVVRPSPATPLDSPDGTTIRYDGKTITDIGDVAYSYVDYLADYKDKRYTHAETGAPRRRVVTIPIVGCENRTPGSGSLPVRGFGCFLLLQPMIQHGSDAWIFGQFVEPCTASGNPGGEGGPGVYKIVLHNDPDSSDS